jgi:hypothetical protein
MQRLVNSSGQSLIWGEPYGAASICHFMVEPLRRIPRELEDVRFLGEHVNRAELTENFIANLYPPTQDLLTAHKAFWDALLAEPARRLGLSRWGFKEVRLSVDEAHYLKWLYPQAKFIFIYRNPFDAYLSYQGTGDRTWFSIWPEVPICGADDFGKHWNKLVTDFIDRAHEVNGLVVRFEDLIKDEQLIKRISEHIELSIDPSVLKVQVGSSPSAYKATALELDSLRRSASPIIERLGYTAPTF